MRYLFSPTVINEDWRDDEGPHPSALRAATFPRGEGFWIASAGILPSPLGKVAGAKRRSDEVPRRLAKSPFAAGLNSYRIYLIKSDYSLLLRCSEICLSRHPNRSQLPQDRTVANKHCKRRCTVIPLFQSKKSERISSRILHSPFSILN